MAGSQIHEAAADCISFVLQALEEDTLSHRNPLTGEPVIELQQLQLNLFTQIISLEEPYQLSVAHEDMDK